MRESPRVRRLRSDLKALGQLKADSSILDFTTNGSPVDTYTVRFNGKGLWQPEGSSEVLLRDYHEMTIVLGASYPRMMPDLAWKTPIFHPNISAGGVVCLGGYGTHWVPSVNLDELCIMLWDMIRYKNFDVESPYNRNASGWAKSQTQYLLPLDHRPLRDIVARKSLDGNLPGDAESLETVTAEVYFLDDDDSNIIDAEVINAEIIEEETIDFTPIRPDGPDVLFIE